MKRLFLVGGISYSLYKIGRAIYAAPGWCALGVGLLLLLGYVNGYAGLALLNAAAGFVVLFALVFIIAMWLAGHGVAALFSLLGLLMLGQVYAGMTDCIDRVCIAVSPTPEAIAASEHTMNWLYNSLGIIGVSVGIGLLAIYACCFPSKLHESPVQNSRYAPSVTHLPNGHRWLTDVRHDVGLE